MLLFKRKIILIFACSVLLPGKTLLASDDFFGEISVSTQEDVVQQDTPVEFHGFVQQKLKYGINKIEDTVFERNESGISQLRTDIHMELNGKLSDVLDWRVSAKTELDWVAWEDGDMDTSHYDEKTLLKDFYVDASFENGLWIRAGHQVFAWGESEGLVITDVLSPSDSREPGQAELRDLREQIPALLASMPLGSTNLALVASWDAGFNRYATRNEDFYPLVDIKRIGFSEGILDPRKDWELAAKWEIPYNGGDFSLVAAEVNDNELRLASVNEPDAVALLGQARQRHLGFSLAHVYGSWLIKSEVGLYDYLQDARLGFSDNAEQIRAMLGFEYSGWQDWTITYEANAMHNDEQLEDVEDERSQHGQVLRIRKHWLNEKWVGQFWVIDLVGDVGEVYRGDLEYVLSDSFKLATSLVLYDADEESDLFYPYKNHDSLNMSLTYSF